MSVPASIRKDGPYATDGTNRNWAYTFGITDKSHLILAYTDANNITTYPSSTLWDVSNIDGGAGTLTYPRVVDGAALPVGGYVRLIGATPFTQPSVIRNQSAYFPVTHEEAWDHLSRQIQQLFTKITDATLSLILADRDYGDITVSGSGQNMVIDNDAVTNAKLTDMAASTIKGRAVGAGTGDPTDLTATQATAILNNFVASGAGNLKGLVPAPGASAGTAKVLKENAVWALLGAAEVVNTPAGGVAATNVQAAINELDTEKYDKTGGTITGSMTITGDLIVQGTTTQIDATNLAISDSVIEVARGNSGATAPYGGIKMERGGTDAFWVYNEATDRWTAYTSTNDLSTAGTLGVIEAATFVGALSGNATTASAWATARTLTLGTDLSGNVSFDGSANFTLNATIANSAVTNAKMANMAQQTIKGRAVSAGTGAPVDLSSAQATAIIDAMVGDSGAGGTKGLAPAPAAGDAAAQKYLSADGTWKVPVGTGGAPGNAQYIVAALDPTLTNERAATDTGSISWDFSTGSQAKANIVPGSVDNTLAADMAQARIKGRAVAAGSGDPTDLTGTQATAILDLFTSTLQGLVPGSGGGTANFLRADGTWANPGAAAWTLVTKATDESRSSSTTLTNDGALTFAVAANTKYVVRIEIAFTSGGTPDFKWAITGPASPTKVSICGTDITTSLVANPIGDAAFATSHPSTGSGASTGSLALTLYLQNGANSGNVTFQWAQNTSDASATVVLAGSFMEYRSY